MSAWLLRLKYCISEKIYNNQKILKFQWLYVEKNTKKTIHDELLHADSTRNGFNEDIRDCM